MDSLNEMVIEVEVREAFKGSVGVEAGGLEDVGEGVGAEEEGGVAWDFGGVVGWGRGCEEGGQVVLDAHYCA